VQGHESSLFLLGGLWLIDQVLSGLTDFTAAYLDDIVIYSSTWEDHLQHLEVVINHI